MHERRRGRSNAFGGSAAVVVEVVTESAVVAEVQVQSSGGRVNGAQVNVQ